MKKAFIFSLLLFIGHTIYAQQETDNQIKLLMEQNANLKKRLENIETQMGNIHNNDPENQGESIFNNEVEPVELRLGSYNPKIPKFNIIPYKNLDIESEGDSNEDEVSIFNAPPPKSTFGIKETMGKIANTPDFGSSSTRGVEDLSELSDYDVLTGESPYGSGKDDYMYKHQSTMEVLSDEIQNITSPTNASTSSQSESSSELSGHGDPLYASEKNDAAQQTKTETNDSINAIMLGIIVSVLFILFFLYIKM